MASHLLGHEASGTVVDVGADVTKVAPGDDVILTWIKFGHRVRHLSIPRGGQLMRGLSPPSDIGLS